MSVLLEQPKLALSADHDEEHECLCDDNGAAMSEDTAAADLLFELIEASAAERMSSIWGGTVVVGDLDPGFVARYELETVATRVAPRTHIGGGGQGASDEVLFGRSSRHADARDSLMLLKSQMQAMPGIAISPRNSILRYSQLLATGSRAVLERIGGETQEKRKSEQETQEWAGAGGLVGSGDVTLGEISQSIDVDDPNVTSDPQTQDILAGPRLLYPHAQEHLTHLDVQVLLSEAFLVLYKASRTAVSIKQCVASGTGVSSSATPLIHGQLAIQGVAVGPAASGSLGPSSHGGHSFNVGGRKMHKRTTSSASRASQQSTASSGSAHGVLRILSKQPSLDSLAEARPSLSGSQSRPSFEPALSTSRTPAVDHAHSQHGRQASPMHSSSVRASPRKVLQAIGSKVRSLFTGQGSRFRDGGSPGHNHQPQHHQNTSQHPASDQSKHDRRAVLEGLARMHACQLSMLNTTDPARLLTLHAEAIQRFHALKQTLNSVRFATVQMLKTHVTPESPGNNAANEPPDSRGQKSPPLANPRQMGKAGGAEGESDHESPSAAAAAASRRPALSDPKLRQHLSTEERLWMDMICRERTPSEFVELFFDIVVADLDVGELLEKYGSEAA
ncbi:hypothetical protein HK105_200861 [Polyrhizophydium stewartii]|uniref:Uncharacterized protein n=1 Tax=Polyrhizophydium stewartii TaxID=2732419 RepID=A0ABR4NI64_9FUNG